MKHWTNTLCLLLALLAGLAAQAQEDKDARYLAGAVPEVDGKVIFSRQYRIPGMSQDEIHARLLRWMTQRLKDNGNDSRVLYSNPERGQLVGTGDEWIVFTSNALSLDRTRILYQLTAITRPEQCDFRIEKIRFVYREGEERYTAEEWITDKYALNKSKTKLIRGLAKWRRKTVDFMDQYFQQVAEALSAAEPSADTTATESQAQPQVQEPEPPATAPDQPILITPKRKVEVTDPAPTTPASAPAPTTPAQPEGTLRAVSPSDLTSADLRPGSGRLVIVIGTDPFNQTVMTANAGGSLGTVEGKPAVFAILSPEQPHEALDNAAEYEVRFYPDGSREPTLVLHCRRLSVPDTPEGMPRTYAGEIVSAQRK